MSETVLSLTDLTWRPSTRRLPTIDGLSLQIPPGQHVLLTGPSGSGKSTVLRALAGLLDPVTGDLNGEAPGPQRPGERGLLLQNPEHALVGAIIGRDTAIGPENAALDRAAIQEAVAAALDAARVAQDSVVDPRQTSGGQQQRIALAGSLALGPSALLLDEPCSMLDPVTAAEVRAAVLAATQGRTMVVADHDTDAWRDHVDRVIVLGPQARIVADGAPHEVLGSPERPREAAEHPVPSAPPEGSSPTEALFPGEGHPSSGEDPVLTARGLAIARRRDSSGSALLTNLDLTLRPGTMTALVGPSGVGKTTLLRVLLGLEEPLAGTLEQPTGHDLAWVPQNPEHSFVAPTVREEVLASPWATAEGLADQLLDRAGLAALGRANPYTISGGEQRRLALVAALAQRPRLLVLDEPTVGLDPQRCAVLLDLLDQARREGCAIVVASHDPRVATAADEVVRLERAAAHSVLSSPGPHASDGARVSTDRRILPVPRAPRVVADALNPLTLCAIGLLGALGSFAVTHWAGGLLALLPILLLAPLTVRSLGGAAWRMLPVLLSAATLAWTTALLGTAPTLSGEAWLLGLKEACRITVFVAPGVLTFTVLDPTALGDALIQRLRFPARPVVASVAALVRSGHLRDQWAQITQARTLRGLGGPRSPRMLASATLALLVDGLRAAEQQALALDARGFATATHRSCALPSLFTRADAVGLGIGGLLLVWPWIAGVLGTMLLAP